MPQFTAKSAAAMARKSHAPDSDRDDSKRRPREDTQAKRLQDRMIQIALDPSTPGHIAAACARAWDDLAERLRIIKGKGAPKPVPARNEPKQRKARPPVA